MKIGFVTQWYDPEPGPASLPGVFARGLSARGHEVTVLTGFPNYPQGRIFAGYRQRPRTIEQVDGVRVVRVPLYPDHSSSARGRLANYASFALSATALAGGLLRDVDVLWAYNSPATVTLPLLWHARRGRLRYVLHVQDLWPESVVESGLLTSGSASSLAAATIRCVVKQAEGRANKIAVISPTVIDVLRARGVPDDKMRLVLNPADESVFAPRPRDEVLREELGWAEAFVLLYAGAIGDVQGLDTVVEALALLREHPQIRLALVGGGTAEEALRLQAERLGVFERLDFLGRVPPADVPQLLAAADLNLVSLRDKPFLRATMPSKIGSLLSSGVPVLAVVAGDAGGLIEAAGAGVRVQPGDAAAIAAALLDLRERDVADLEAMGAAGRRYYLSNMSVDAALDRLEPLLAESCKP